MSDPAHLDPLLSVQLDATTRLRGSDLLADAEIRDLRPRTEEEATAIQDGINLALAGFEGPTGKGGIAILIPMPAFEVDQPDNPAPVGDIILAVQVLEKIMINEGPGGTGITCEACAWTVARLLHQFLMRPNQLVYFDRMRPLDVSEQQDWDADVAWEVRFKLRGGVDPLPACDIPRITYDSETGEVTITTTTPGGVILFTTDGTLPWSGSATAVPFDEHFAAPASGSSVRAITTKPGLTDSGAAELVIP